MHIQASWEQTCQISWSGHHDSLSEHIVEQPLISRVFHGCFSLDSFGECSIDLDYSIVIVLNWWIY